MNPCTALTSLNQASPSTLVANSSFDFLRRSVGTLTTKEIVLTGGAGAKTYSCFTIAGTVELKALYGVFTNVANVVTVQLCSWDLNDGAATVALCNSVNCSGAVLNSVISKQAAVGVAAVFQNSTAVSVSEVVAGPDQFQSAQIVARNTGTTTLRFQVTQDANTAARILVYAAWVPRTASGLLVAV